MLITRFITEIMLSVLSVSLKYNHIFCMSTVHDRVFSFGFSHSRRGGRGLIARTYCHILELTAADLNAVRSFTSFERR